MEPQIDFIGQNSAEGLIANQLLANRKFDVGMRRPFIGTDGGTYVTVHKSGNPKKKESYQTVRINQGNILANSTLRREEWQRLDEAILPIRDTRLGGIGDLIEKGLVFDLGETGMGNTILEHHNISDAMEAEMTMDGLTRGKADRVNYESVFLPLPIIHVDYEINERVLQNSRNLGQSLDVASAERAARQINQKLEDLLFTSTSYSFGGGTIYSYLNHPNRNTVTLTANWDASAKTPTQIKNDVLSLKQAAINARCYGPYALYIPTAYETVLDDDYDTTTPGKTIRTRLMEINNLDTIKVIDTLPANNILLVQMTTDTVRLVRGMGMQNIQWDKEGGFVNKFKVLTIQVPQLRVDQASRSGVVHMS